MALAKAGTTNYTFTDGNTGASLVVKMTMGVSSSDPNDALTILDGGTRVGAGSPSINGDGNWIEVGEGITFSASIVSASETVNTNSVKFRVVGIGTRAYANVGWTSSAGTVTVIPDGTERISLLDTNIVSLAGTNYSGVMTCNQMQLTQAGSLGGIGLVMEASFSTVALSASSQVGGVMSTDAPSLSFINSNSVVIAANFGGSPIVRDGISFTGITSTSNPMTNAFGNYNVIVSAPSGSLNTGTFGDLLFGTFIWASDQSQMNVKIEGLSSTNSYQVYYLAGDNRAMNFNMLLTLTGSDADTSTSVVTNMNWGSNSSSGQQYIYLPVNVSRANSLNATMTINGGAGVAFSGLVVVDPTANVAPTLSTISTLTNATEDTAYTINYAALKDASDAADANGNPISFRIESVTSGTMTKNGTNIVEGSTLLSTNETIVWTPATNANGTLPAFTIKATDGTLASSSAIQVNVNVTAVNDRPTVENSIPAQNAAVGAFFSYTFDTNIFSDVDSELGYSFGISEAYTFPMWLNFNAATRTLSGTPTNSGSFGGMIVANDGQYNAYAVFTVTVAGPMSPPTITIAQTNLCSGGAYTASGPAGLSGYEWSISNGFIPGNRYGESVLFSAGDAGPAILTLVATNSLGQVATNSVATTVYYPPGASIFAAGACANSSGNTASASAGMAAYAWTISNGTITSATNIQTITYTAGSSGVVGLGLLITSPAGCSSGDYTEVAISPYPTASITTATNVLANSTGNTASAPGEMNSYAWTISNGTITSDANIQTITYTAGTSGSVGLNVVVGNSSGCLAGSSTSVAISVPVIPPDPRTNSWMTSSSGRYARIYKNKFDQTNGVASTTWSNSLNQSTPVYAGVQEIYSSTNWVYVRASGLGSHVMGPWYFDAQKTQIFAPWPINQKNLFRVPRTPVVTTNKTLTATGAVGYFVDGVAMFDDQDSFFWNGTTETNNGTGYWYRDAYVNEGPSFDPNNAHQQQQGVYHYHANPPALRYLLGDNVTINPISKTYTENATNANTKHSPILGWMRDGYPLYGPYGYSVATNANSGVRRMISGFVLRNGQKGTDNLTTTGRTGLPLWAARLYNTTTNRTGPAVAGQYTLGRYLEDNAYLGDLGYQQGTDFDLDEYNGRYCVTPEFPNGTYAYFVSIETNGAPKMPYNIGRAYYGVPNGGGVSTISETVVTNFVGGTNVTTVLNKPNVQGSTVTLTWSAVEGGSYRVDSSTNLSSWPTLAASVTANGATAGYTNSTTHNKQFYRVARTGVATNDSTGTTLFTTPSVAPGGSGARGTTVTVTITLPSNPPQPPATSVPTSVTLGGTINGTLISRPSQETVQATFVIPAGASTGAKDVVVTFSPGPAYTLSGGFTIN